MYMYASWQILFFSAPPTTRASDNDVNSTHLTRIPYISTPIIANQKHWCLDRKSDKWSWLWLFIERAKGWLLYCIPWFQPTTWRSDELQIDNWRRCLQQSWKGNAGRNSTWQLHYYNWITHYSKLTRINTETGQWQNPSYPRLQKTAR